MNSDAGESSQFNEFHGKNPVTLLKLVDVVSARGLKHVWFEIKRVLSGKVQLPNTNLVPAQQERINQHAAMLRTAQDKVESSCIALEAPTSQYNIERAVEEGNKRECLRQAQKIKAEIAVLQARLQYVEDAYSSAQR
uniref:Uncharacterized protein n=1 Tax=Oryza punctata TaxID=4537 RepID=A0A0E0KEV6_ORYPU